MNELGRKQTIIFIIVLFSFSALYMLAELTEGTISYTRADDYNASSLGTTSSSSLESQTLDIPKWPAILDKEDYDKRLLALVRYQPPKPISVVSTSTNASGTIITTVSTTTPPSPLRYSSSSNVTIEGKTWPKASVYPQGGAILPFKRILAYYGNFYSKQMGILGEFEPDVVLEHLAKAQAEWEKADPTTPVLPAIEYIAMVAQAGAGADGMYRAVMPDSEIEKAYELTKQINGVMILDIQIGLSPLTNELPKFKKYLERPDVFFALDPEFAMKTGAKPGTVIGSLNATDINYAINYLAEIVRENKLPPKVLLVHRFTQDMVKEAALIVPQPEVQVVIVMDGWGSKDLKRGTYSHVIVPEPVQFTGIKVFYKNDLKPPSTGLLTPAEILDLHPNPIYIQYQ